MLGDGSTNINVLGATAGSGSGAPTAFQGGLYQWALTQQNQRFEDRERLNSELFGVYIDGLSDKEISQETHISLVVGIAGHISVCNIKLLYHVCVL